MMTRYRGRGDLLHLLTVHLLAVDGSGGRSGRRRLTVHLLLGTVRILLLLLLAVDGSNGCGDVRRSRRLTVRGSGCAIHLGGGGEMHSRMSFSCTECHLITWSRS